MSSSTPSAGTSLQRLVDIVARLRAPDGCAWDRQQTIASLKPYVLEETYEVIEAIERGDHVALCEELGDYLFEAIFVAQIADEAGLFSIADAATQAADKLVRRHPHVFARSASQPVLDPDAVRVQWEQIKAQERRDADRPSTVLGDVPHAMPALLRAYRLGARAASVGFDWPAPRDVVEKLREEVDEIAEVIDHDPISVDRLEDEVGDLLFAVANLARALRVEPESALRRANEKFVRRFTAMETRAGERGRTLDSLSLEELEAEWAAVKASEGS